MIPASSQWSAAATQNGAMNGVLDVIMTISGYSRVFTVYDHKTSGWYPWISDPGTFSSSESDLSGSSSISNAQVTVIDYQNLLTADMATFSFQGKTVTIQVGFPGLTQTEYLPIATMLINKVDSNKNNTAYTFDLRDNSLQLQNYVWLIGNDGYDTSSSNPVTVQGSPMELLEDVLEQAGISSSQINSTALNNIANNILYGIYFDFNVTYPPQGKSWIEQELMVPLACWWFWNYAGQFTPVCMVPYTQPTPAITLTQYLISDKTMPVAKQSSNYISDFAYFMDLDSNGQNAGNIFEMIYAPAFNVYGMSQIQQIRSRGVKSALGGFRIAQLIMYALCNRYGFKPLTCSVDCLLPAMVCEIGDPVYLTYPNIPNRVTGNMGMTNVLWEVTSAKKNLKTGVTTLGLLDVSWMQAPAYQLAPSGIPNFPSASPTQQQEYMFVAGASGTYSNGTAGNEVY
jgi:hypothetical protein